jgi:RNA polymerase sigma factor (sigma-70 family)
LQVYDPTRRSTRSAERRGGAPADQVALQAELLERAERLYRYIESKIPAKFQAVIAPEDVLQEIWIGAMRSFANFNPTRPSALDRWLMGITNHKLIDALKTAARVKRGGNAQIAHAAHDRRTSLTDLFARIASPRRTPSRDAAADEAAHAMQIALSCLPDDRRRAIQMKYLEGRSRQEIACKMRKSEAAVNSLLFHGLRDLRYRLGDVAKFFSNVRSSNGVKTR